MDYFKITVDNVKEIRKQNNPNSIASVVTGDVVQETTEPQPLENSQETTQDVIE